MTKRIAFTFIVILAAALSGCRAESAMQQTMVAEQAFTAAVDTLATYRQAGHISDREYIQIDKWVQLGDGALDDMQAAARSGNAVGYVLARNTLARTLDHLLIEQIEIEEATE